MPIKRQKPKVRTSWKVGLSIKEIQRRKLAIRVAKDVVKRIGSGELVPISGYFSFEIDGRREIEPHRGRNLQAFIKSCTVCKACAIGSAFLSLVRLTNEYEVEYSLSREIAVPEPGILNRARFKLSEAFEIEQQAIIEVAYMGSAMHAAKHGVEIDESVLSATHYRDVIPDDDKRMLAIFNNVIENHGIFVLPDKNN